MTTPPISSLRRAAMATTPDYSDVEDRTGQNLIPAPSLMQRASNALFDAKNTLAQYNFSPSSMLDEAKRQYNAGKQQPPLAKSPFADAPSDYTTKPNAPMAKMIR